jgi:hypothetical protein
LLTKFRQIQLPKSLKYTNDLKLKCIHELRSILGHLQSINFKNTNRSIWLCNGTSSTVHEWYNDGMRIENKLKTTIQRNLNELKSIQNEKYHLENEEETGLNGSQSLALEDLEFIRSLNDNDTGSLVGISPSPSRRRNQQKHNNATNQVSNPISELIQDGRESRKNRFNRSFNSTKSIFQNDSKDLLFENSNSNKDRTHRSSKSTILQRSIMRDRMGKSKNTFHLLRSLDAEYRNLLEEEEINNEIQHNMRSKIRDRVYSSINYNGVCSDSGSSRKMVVSEAISPTISPTLSPITSFSKFSPSNKWSPSRRERFDD